MFKQEYHFLLLKCPKIEQVLAQLRRASGKFEPQIAIKGVHGEEQAIDAPKISH